MPTPESSPEGALALKDAGAPHSLEAERGVLGSILLDTSSGAGSRVIDLCTEAGIAPDAFYSQPHALLFETLQEMARAGAAIDPVTLTERLKALNRFDSVGGLTTIQSLIDNTPTAAHAEYYIDILRQKFLLRRIIESSRDAERRCFDEAVSPDVILGEVEQNFLSLSDRSIGGQLTWPQALNSTMAAIEHMFELGPNGILGLPTGLANLDQKLHGLRAGEMIVLAARPSMGKTSLAMNIAECVSCGTDIFHQPMKFGHNRPHAVLVFSLEMSSESLAMRMLCGYAGVPGFQIMSGYGSAKKYHQALTRAASELIKAPLFIDDSGGLDVMDLRARARRHAKRHAIELIVIDYLQLCNCREFAKQGRQIETSQISAQIKSMAKELKVPVIVLSQLSRAPEQRGDKLQKPKLSDLRDSGAIEQDADVVLLLRRPCKAMGDPEHDDQTLAIVDVAKHRNGPTGEVRLNFDGDTTRFSDRADEAHDETAGFEPSVT